VKKIKILENRLDKANQKFNETISHNKVLREEIDTMRKEKGIFETVYTKLDKQV
jgi:coiled-coil domain-containing protein 63/114